MQYKGPTQCADPIKLFRQDKTVVSQLKKNFDNWSRSVIVSPHVADLMAKAMGAAESKTPAANKRPLPKLVEKSILVTSRDS